jgi:hypothetical protein
VFLGVRLSVDFTLISESFPHPSLTYSSAEIKADVADKNNFF